MPCASARNGWPACLPPWRGAAWSPSGCFRPERLAGLFAALEGSGLEPKRLQFAAHRPDCPPRLALVEAVRQGRPGLEVLPVRYRNTL